MSEEHMHHAAPQIAQPTPSQPAAWLKPALILMALALVGAGAYSLFEYNSEKQTQKVAAEIGTAILGKEGAERLTALDGLLNQNLGSSKSYVLLEAARTALSMQDYAKAAAYWGKLEGASDSTLAALAVLGKASAQSQAGDNASALAALTAFAPKCPKAFELVLTRQLAVAAEATGNVSLAVASYEKMLPAANVQTKAYLEDKIVNLKKTSEGEKKGS